MDSKESKIFEELFGKLTPKLKEELDEKIEQQKNSSSNKHKGTVSRKRGKKIMHGYKIGGKV